MSKVSNRLTRAGKLLLNGTFDEATFNAANLGTKNLLRHTQDFSNVVWSRTATTVSTNLTTAPDTTLTADKVIGDNGITTRKSIYQPYNFIAGTKYTFSIYLKQAGFTNATIWYDTPNVSEGAYFGASSLINLTNGTRTGTQTTVTDAGNGWYRCSITFTPTVSQSTNLQISLGDANGSGTATGDGVSGVYMWGAQLEYDIVPTVYQGMSSANTLIPALFKTKTTLDTIYVTDIFDEGTYNTVTPVFKNMLTYTDSMTSANGWAIGANTTFVSSATAPNGTMTANRYTGNGSGGNEYVAKQVVYEANETYTASVWARLASGSVPSVGTILTIGYHNGSIGTRATVNYSGNLTSDWKRFSVTYTNVVAGTHTGYFIADQTNTAQIDVWGAQIEKNSIATEYQSILALNNLNTAASKPKSEGKRGTIFVKDTFDEWTGAPVVDTSTVLWLDAGQEASYVGSGTTWTDLSGKGNNGTLTNSPTFNTLGYINYANNTTQYTTFANSSTLLFTGTLPYTIDVWAQIDQYPPTSTWKRIVDRESDVGLGREGYTFWVNGVAGGTNVEFTTERFVTGSATYCGLQVPWATIGSSWNHWVVKYTGSQLYLYRNGTVVAGPIADTRSISNNTRILNVGGKDNSAIGGNVSSVKIYNRALNDEEIKQNFNALRRRYGI